MTKFYAIPEGDNEVTLELTEDQIEAAENAGYWVIRVPPDVPKATASDFDE